MDSKKRAELVITYARQAREYHRVGDVVRRNQAARNWAEVASLPLMKRSPRLVRWAECEAYVSGGTR